MISNLHPQISDSSMLIGRGSNVVNFGLTFMEDFGLYLEADFFFAFGVNFGFASRIDIM